MKQITFPIILVLFFLTSIQSGYSQLNCYSLQAPTFSIPGMEKIAIMNFVDRRNSHWYYNNKDHGGQLADYMIALLLEEHRGVYTEKKNKENKSDISDLTMSKLMQQKKAKKYAQGNNYMDRYRTDVYTVVERGELDKIMAEQSLGANGAVSDVDAAKVGELLGLDVIITGGYTSDVTSSVKNTSSSRSSYTAKKKANVDVTMKIISIETGEILTMVNKTASQKRSASGSSYSGASGGLPSDDHLIRECLQEISKELVSHFAPTFVYQALEIEKPLGKSYKEEFKEARELVKEDDLSGAFITLKEVYDADPYDAAMAHNMGVIYEAVGNFDEAIEYHKAAYEIDPTKNHTASLERAMDSKEALDELGKLGVDVSPYKFDKGAKERLAIEKVTTKGKKTDRYEVYADANKGSDIQAKVPGDTEFVKLGEEGSYYKIKLIGGKEGFISKEFLNLKKK
ncbi:MAG: CsgG/HfaB family protein [Salibacteraceae bacterium]